MILNEMASTYGTNGLIINEIIELDLLEYELINKPKKYKIIKTANFDKIYNKFKDDYGKRIINTALEYFSTSNIKDIMNPPNCLGISDNKAELLSNRITHIAPDSTFEDIRLICIIQDKNIYALLENHLNMNIIVNTISNHIKHKNSFSKLSLDKINKEYNMNIQEKQELKFESISSFVMSYNLLKELGRPFKDFEAYKLGLIDEDGKKLKSAETDEEKEAMNSFTKIVLNLKRLMSRAGIKHQNGQKLVSLFLLKEDSLPQATKDSLMNKLNEEVFILKQNPNDIISEEMAELIVQAELTYFNGSLDSKE